MTSTPSRASARATSSFSGRRHGRARRLLSIASVVSKMRTCVGAVGVIMVVAVSLWVVVVAVVVMGNFGKGRDEKPSKVA